jgi:hypothetical protein
MTYAAQVYYTEEPKYNSAPTNIKQRLRFTTPLRPLSFTLQPSLPPATTLQPTLPLATKPKALSTTPKEPNITHQRMLPKFTQRNPSLTLLQPTPNRGFGYYTTKAPEYHITTYAGPSYYTEVLKVLLCTELLHH